jgi:Winged helix-turn-helix DNA-binding
LAWIAAAIIESLGLTTVSTSLLLWEYNADKRKTDPDAPFLLAASLVGVYLVSTIGLTVLLDIFPDLARYAPALFPILALVGAVNLALRSGHRRRLATIAHERADRKAERQANHPKAVNFTEPLTSNATSITVNTDSSLVKARQARAVIQGNRMDNLLTLYRDNPTIGVTDAARTLNMSRQTVYSYLDRLENDGRIRRNGHGVEIIKG